MSAVSIRRSMWASWAATSSSSGAGCGRARAASPAASRSGRASSSRTCVEDEGVEAPRRGYAVRGSGGLRRRLGPGRDGGTGSSGPVLSPVGSVAASLIPQRPQRTSRRNKKVSGSVRRGLKALFSRGGSSAASKVSSSMMAGMGISTHSSRGRRVWRLRPSVVVVAVGRAVPVQAARCRPRCADSRPMVARGQMGLAIR